MTENEKLRALLAEARGVIDEGYDRGSPAVVERIDAALAEPVVPCGDCGHPLTEVRPGKHQCDVCDDLRLHKEDRLRLRVENLRLERERDEARAERDHFRAMLRERADALLAAQEEIERLKLRFNAQWQECHDGSNGSCCKAHE